MNYRYYLLIIGFDEKCELTQKYTITELIYQFHFSKSVPFITAFGHLLAGNNKDIIFFDPRSFYRNRKNMIQ